MPGMNLVLPAGENIKTYKGALMLNDTAAFIYELLQEGLDFAAIVERMLGEFDVTPEKAEEGKKKTFTLLIEGGVAEE